MGSAFKRPKYGKVRPVPKAKVKAPERPQVSELRSIYSRLQKSPEKFLNDILSEALTWWADTTPWFQFRYRKIFPLDAAKALSAADAAKVKGQAALKNEEKMKYFLEALAKYRRFASPVLKTPELGAFLKKSKEVTKKNAKIDNNLAARFDKVLTLLSQAFPSCKLSFKAVEKIAGDGNCKIDHALSTIYYSRPYCKRMQTQLNQEGLLSLVISEAFLVARAMSMVAGGNGSFLVDDQKVFANYRELLRDFEIFSRSEKAPNRLVRRKVKAPVTPRRGKSILDEVSDEETAAFMSKATVYKGKAAKA